MVGLTLRPQLRCAALHLLRIKHVFMLFQKANFRLDFLVYD